MYGSVEELNRNVQVTCNNKKIKLEKKTKKPLPRCSVKDMAIPNDAKALCTCVSCHSIGEQEIRSKCIKMGNKLTIHTMHVAASYTYISSKQQQSDQIKPIEIEKSLKNYCIRVSYSSESSQLDRNFVFTQPIRWIGLYFCCFSHLLPSVCGVFLCISVFVCMCECM